MTQQNQRRRFGLLGRRLGHSLSPQIHALFGSVPYALIELEPEALGPFLESRDFDGLNVTIPYKRSVMPYCAELTARAQAVGAVNTIVKRADGSLLGDNTDCIGFEWSLDACGVDVRGAKCLVLGTGGASLAVRYALEARGAAEVVRISRSGPECYENIGRHADAKLVVNATPVGMSPAVDASPLTEAAWASLPALEGAIDLIYNPLRTAFLQAAAARGLRTENGLGMLVMQGKAAAERFLGRAVDAGEASRALSRIRAGFENIVLIGMPGAGKSTVAHLVAEQLGRPLVDADAEIEARAGKSIPDIFAESGESGFRDAEAAVIADAAKRRGIVLATGGGAVLRPENRCRLRMNGFVVWLERGLDVLASDGRPMTAAKGVKRLFDERAALYEAAADLRVRNVEGAPQAAAGEILAAFGRR